MLRFTNRLLLTLGLICLSNPGLAQPTIAPIMPLADQSLLLDIVAAGERTVVAGERGHVLYSDDDGNTWIQARVPTTQMLTAIHFTSEDTGWAVGHDGIVLSSRDGAETWRVQRDGLAAQRQQTLEKRDRAVIEIGALKAQLADALESTEIDENTITALEIALEDAEFDLEDAELALTEPTFTSPLMDVWFADNRKGWAVGAFGTLIATADGGVSWLDNSTLLDNPEEFHLNAITGDAAGRLLIAGESGVLFRSLDNGQTWESLPQVYGGSWFGALYDPHSEALLIFGLRGNIFRSTDFGDSWAAVDTSNSLTLAGGNASENGHVVLAGSVGRVLHSSDGGQNFHKTAIEDRLSLSSGLLRGNRLLLVGQGGIRRLEVTQ